MAEGNPYIESKPRASLIKCFMSLYCTNIDVYFDKRDVQFQMCWKIWYAQLQFEAPGFGEIWLKVVGCFYKKSVGIHNSISHPVQTGFIFFHYRVLRFMVLFVSGCCWFLYWLHESFVYKIRIWCVTQVLPPSKKKREKKSS